MSVVLPRRLIEGALLMRIALLAVPVLLIGVALIGCSASSPQGKLDPDLPVVSIQVEGMS